MPDRKKRLKWIGVGAALTLALLVIGGVIALYAGVYNVAASVDHTRVGRWVFETTMHNSVERRAAKVTAPALTPAMFQAGANHYKAMCQQCHAGPGVSRAEWAHGMLPLPPHMSEAAREWKPTEIFWIVKHGLKMSGMPSFGETHDDRTIWDIVAFVNEVPSMTPAEYGSVGNEGHHGPSSGATEQEAHGPPGHHQ